MILRFLGSNWTGTLAASVPSLACQLLGVTLGEERPGCVELGQAQTLGDLPGWLEFKEKVECEGCECSRQAPDCSALGLSDQGYEMGLKLPSPHRALRKAVNRRRAKSGECLSQLPPLPHRATRSSCSSTMEMPPWCPCGCAGRWRRGGASRAPPEAGWTLRAQDWSPRGRPTCCAFSVCCPHRKSFAGLTFDTAGRWPCLGSPQGWPALQSQPSPASGLEA